MALDDEIAWFERHALLSRMGREALRLLAFSADRRNFRAGDVLARKGEPADTAFLVVSGVLALDERDDGRPAAVLAGEGALVGEMTLFAATERPATVLAREPTTVLVLRREVMHRVLGEFPDAAIALHQAIADDIRSFTAKLKPVRSTLERLGDG